MKIRKGDSVGQMKKRIQIWSSDPTMNSMNEPTGGKHTLLSTRWAKVDMKKGVEMEQDGVVYEADIMAFTIRYKSTLDDQTHIIVYKNVEYDIISIENIDEMDRFMVILAERRT